MLKPNIQLADTKPSFAKEFQFSDIELYLCYTMLTKSSPIYFKSNFITFSKNILLKNHLNNIGKYYIIFFKIQSKSTEYTN